MNQLANRIALLAVFSIFSTTALADDGVGQTHTPSLTDAAVQADSTAEPIIDPRRWARFGIHGGSTGATLGLGGALTLSSDRLFLAAEVGSGLGLAGDHLLTAYARAGMSLLVHHREGVAWRLQPMVGYRSGLGIDKEYPLFPTTGSSLTTTLTVERTAQLSPRVGLSVRASGGFGLLAERQVQPDLGLTIGLTW